MVILNKGIDLINEVDKCTVKSGNAAFWWIGQAGYIVKLDDTIIYLDAFLSERNDRNIPPLLKPKEVVNADFIFGSHDHADHIDRDVWHQISLSSPKAKFVVPKLLIKALSKDLKISESRFIGLDDNMTVSDKNIKITGVAAAHEFLDQDQQTGNFPYLGFIIEGNGCKIYHSGDTCIYEGLYSKLRKLGRLDIMFIPINGRDAERYARNCIGNMTYQEAADLAGTIRPKIAVPGHYEMFTGNSENPSLFADYMDVKYPKVKYWIGKHGEMVLINSSCC